MSQGSSPSRGGGGEAEEVVAASPEEDAIKEQTCRRDFDQNKAHCNVRR